MTRKSYLTVRADISDLHFSTSITEIEARVPAVRGLLALGSWAMARV
jgi:hypothetical protein